jgi:dTDP-4-amino-4,6-dideoxygalactose transaminase
MERIPVSGPWITAKEIEYVTDAVTNAWYEKANVYHARFEEAFATYLGVRFAIALPSCTSAIHLSLLALGIGPGDEVVVPDITWIATAAPVSYLGATPVFADIDSQTWCLSARSFEACVTSKTKAVIPVDLYGNMPDMDAIRAVARRNGVAIVEDAAEAIGSEYSGKKAGRRRCIQFSRIENIDHRRRRDAGYGPRRSLPARSVSPRPWARTWRQNVLQHRGRLQIQDEQSAGGPWIGAITTD